MIIWLTFVDGRCCVENMFQFQHKIAGCHCCAVRPAKIPVCTNNFFYFQVFSRRNPHFQAAIHAPCVFRLILCCGLFERFPCPAHFSVIRALFATASEVIIFFYQTIQYKIFHSIFLFFPHKKGTERVSFCVASAKSAEGLFFYPVYGAAYTVRMGFCAALSASAYAAYSVTEQKL